MENLSKLANKPINGTNLNLEVEYALILSSLCSLSYSVPPTLLAALVKAGIKTVPYALDIIRENPDEERKRECLVSLIPYLSSHWREAFRIAQEMTDLYRKALTITALAPLIEEKDKNLYPLLRLLLEEIPGDYYDEHNLLIIGSLAQQLPETEAKVIINSLTKKAEVYVESLSAYHVEELLIISSFLQDVKKKNEIVQNALKKAWTIDIEDYELDFFRTIAKVIPHLPSEQKLEQIEKVYELSFLRKGDERQIKALEAIMPHLPKTLVKRAEELIKNKPYRHELYPSLAIRLAEIGEKEEALKIIYSFDDGFHKPQILSLVAPYLSEKYDYSVFKLALDEVRKTPHIYVGYVSILNMSPYLPKTLLEEALDIVQQIRDFSKQEEYIQASSLYVAELGSTEMALGLANKITNYFVSIRTFSLLIEYLERDKQIEVAEDLLSRISVISPEFYKWMELAKLIPCLPESYKTASIEQLISGVKEVNIPTGGEWARRYDKVFGELSVQLASQKYLEECVNIIEIMKEIPNQEEAIRKVVSFLQVEQVRKLLNLVKGFGYFRDHALAVLSFRLVDLGYLTEGLGYIFLVQSDYSRLEGLKKIGDALVKWNKIHQLQKLGVWLLEKKIKSKHLVLAKLANYLEGEFKDRFAKIALEIFQELLATSTDERKKLNLCIPMIPFLFGQYKDEIMEGCRSIIKNLEDRDETADFEKEFIEELIKFLVLNDCFDDTLKIIRSIEPDHWTVKASILKSCFLSIGRLPQEYKNEIVRECKNIIENNKNQVQQERFFKRGLEFLAENDFVYVIEVMQKSLNEYSRVQVLEEVFFLLTRSLKYESLKDELLTIIKSFSTVSRQHLLLLELSFYIPDVVDSGKLLEITKSVVSEEISDSERAKVFPNLVKQLITLPSDLLYQVWDEVLQKLSGKKREIFLGDLKFLLPLIGRLGGVKLIEEVAISVHQVGQWWK